jgi:nucleoside phosphorylase
MLLIENYGLFGAWADPATFEPGFSSKESLEQLIGKGAFKPLDLQALMHGASQNKFSIKDKRSLAVKLGFCLMDFFDADITSRRIYFWNASTSGPKKEFPYLSFDSKLPATTNPYNFRMGHPALLSFAKLLLEIDFGQAIELAISPDSSRNQAAWATLVSLVDRLEEDRGDSYLQAIRGCLNVHRKIAERLRTRDLDEKRAELRIRKTLYKEVVHKLELGLAESIPRPAHKRQRSESPSPSYCENEPRNSSSWRSPTQPSEPRRPIARHKRRRTPEPQNWPSSVASELVTRECKLTSNCTVSELEASLDSSQPKSRRDFEVALICALRVEFDAVEALFDEYYESEPDLSYGKAPGDPNAYTTGRLCGHHVVLAFMPGMGKVNSASVAAGFRASFPDIKLGIVVGICGGVPFGRDEEKDVLLGDVVISTALVQFDLGRQYTNKFVRKDTLQDNLGRPTSDIRSFLAKLSGSKGRTTLRDKTSLYLEELCEKDGFHKSSYPGADNDKLFRPTYRHKHQDPKAPCICANCHSPDDDVCDVALEASCEELGCHDDELVFRERIDKAKLVTHERYPFHETRLHEPQKPVIHFGVVVSGDSVMKSGHHRDEIASREKAVAFEMEGAGVWDSFPTVVIKSVCDYADSHKNKVWQRYAAATAAACMKAFLGEWRQAR